MMAMIGYTREHPRDMIFECPVRITSAQIESICAYVNKCGEGGVRFILHTPEREHWKAIRMAAVTNAQVMCN